MEQFIKYAIAIGVLMLANTLLVSVDKLIEGGFDWKIFIKGLLRYVVILLACIGIFYAGTIMPNIEIMEGLNLVKMLEVVAMALIVKYGVSCFKNLKALFELDINTDESAMV